jgi:hypothetical protein
MGLGCTKDSLASVILGLSGGIPAGRYPVPAPGKGGKASPDGPVPRTGPAQPGASPGRLTLVPPAG